MAGPAGCARRAEDRTLPAAFTENVMTLRSRRVSLRSRQFADLARCGHSEYDLVVHFECCKSPAFQMSAVESLDDANPRELGR